jgi:hypothetical protein
MIYCSNGPQQAGRLPLSTLKSVVNGRERRFPLSDVHPERFADLCTASELVARSGGMSAAVVNVTTSLVQIAYGGLADSEKAACRGREVAAHLLERAVAAAPEALVPGCMPALEVRAYGPEQMLLSLYVEREDGFAIVEPAARAIAVDIARLLGARAPVGFAIGAAERRRVSVKGTLAVAALCEKLLAHGPERGGPECVHAALRQVLAGHAEASVDLAFEHNARVLSGLAAASAIFGAATDFLQAEGQTHAARWGGCESLVRWKQTHGALEVELEVPVALQRIRGIVNAEGIETACSVAEIDSTRALELACASVGLVASVSGLYGDLRAAVAVLAASRRRASQLRTVQLRAVSRPRPTPPSGERLRQ